MRKKFGAYVISVAAALVVGAASAAISGGGFDTYKTLRLPPFAPPSAAFPIVWTVLFILMGIGAAAVYKSASNKRFDVLAVYAAQLAVNFFWSIIFFKFEAYLSAFIWLILLLVLIGVMIFRFWGINKAAAVLQIPYFLWTVFAGYLTLFVYILNK